MNNFCNEISKQEAILNLEELGMLFYYIGQTVFKIRNEYAKDKIDINKVNKLIDTVSDFQEGISKINRRYMR